MDRQLTLSSTGGWDPTLTKEQIDINNPVTARDLEEEVANAFKNVEKALKKAGGKGWSQVFRIVTYSTDISAQNEFLMANIQKWCPDHKPVWTELGVAHLAFPSMHVEIDVEAHDSQK